MLLAQAVGIYVSDIWAICQSNKGFWIFFCISLNSCHAQVPKCLHFKKLILGLIETSLGQRTHSDVLKFILLYSRAKCIFFFLWIEAGLKRYFPEKALLWKWEKISSWTLPVLWSKMSLKSVTFYATSFKRNCMVRASLSRAIHYYSSLCTSFFRVFVIWSFPND